MTTATYTKETLPKLFELLTETEKKLADFRFALSGSKTRNVREGRNLRKEIARIKTEIVGRTAKLA